MRCTSGCSAVSEAAMPSVRPVLKLRPPLSWRFGSADKDSCALEAAEAGAVTDVDASAEDDENSMIDRMRYDCRRST